MKAKIKVDKFYEMLQSSSGEIESESVENENVESGSDEITENKSAESSPGEPTGDEPAESPIPGDEKPVDNSIENGPG